MVRHILLPVVNYWSKLISLVKSLPRESVVRVTDCPDITSAVYHGCKAANKKQLRVVLCLEACGPELDPNVWYILWWSFGHEDNTAAILSLHLLIKGLAALSTG